MQEAKLLNDSEKKCYREMKMKKPKAKNFKNDSVRPGPDETKRLFKNKPV